MELLKSPGEVDFRLRAYLNASNESDPVTASPDAHILFSPQIRGTFFQYDSDSDDFTMLDEKMGRMDVPRTMLETASDSNVPLMLYAQQAYSLTSHFQGWLIP